MINYLIKIIKMLDDINKRLDRLEGKEKYIIGTRTNRVMRVARPTVNTIKINGGR